MIEKSTFVVLTLSSCPCTLQPFHSSLTPLPHIHKCSILTFYWDSSSNTHCFHYTPLHSLHHFTLRHSFHLGKPPQDTMFHYFNNSFHSPTKLWGTKVAIHIFITFTIHSSPATDVTLMADFNSFDSAFLFSISYLGLTSIYVMVGTESISFFLHPCSQHFHS